MKVEWTGWRAAAIAGVVCLLLIAILAALSTNPSDDVLQRRPSTFFTDPSGARGAYLLLQRILPLVEQWRSPFTELQRDSRPRLSTLIVMGPGTPLGRADAVALDAWIAAGGQLILASASGWRVPKTSDESFSKDFLESHGLYRNAGVRGAAAVAHTQVAMVGKGRIVYIPDDHAFSNENLRSTDNGVWLVQACTEWGGTVGFDEYHLGFGVQRGLLPLIAMFAVTPWGLVCLQAALAGGVYLIGYRRRFGRPLDELPVERTNPIETVEAIAGLFEASQAKSLSVRLIHQHLNTYLSAVCGWRIDLLNPQARERLGSPAGIGRRELDAYAEEVKLAMQSTRVGDDSLMRIAQRAAAIAGSLSHGSANKRSAAAG
jgi:hypothetical protein